MEWLSRTELLVGEDIKKLQQAHVLIVGLGGVGAYAAEMITRAGIGELTIVDGDTIQPSNRNRQLPALLSNQNQLKSEVMAQRLLDINPELKLNVISEFIKEDRIIEILNNDYNYVVDAIDTLTPKIALITNSLKKNHKIVSSMGAGGKFDPAQIQIADISKSYNCTLARMLRKRLHKLEVRKGVKVVFSSEIHDKDKVIVTEGEQFKKSTVGTISYMPPLFGCHIASLVIRDLLNS